MVSLGNDWDNILADEWEKSYFKELESFLEEEYAQNKIYPEKNDLFNALKYTSFANTDKGRREIP